MPEVVANGLRLNTLVLRHEGHEGARTPGTGTPGAGAFGPDRPVPVVMLHGLVIDNLSSWYYTLANPVARSVADVYLYDMRGHGRSEMRDTGYGCDENLADLVALLDHWGLTGPVHLVGNSYGCLLALALAHHHPERVASMFLIEAHFSTAGWGFSMAANLAYAAFGIDKDVVQAWLRDYGGRRVNRLARYCERLFNHTSLIADLENEAVTPPSWLRGVRCPTLAVYGSLSDILDRAQLLRDEVPGCRLEIIDGCTHGLLTEATAQIRTLLLDWLQEPGAPAEPAEPAEPVPGRA